MVKELRIKKIKSRYSLAIEACRDLVRAELKTSSKSKTNITK